MESDIEKRQEERKNRRKQNKIIKILIIIAVSLVFVLVILRIADKVMAKDDEFSLDKGTKIDISYDDILVEPDEYPDRFEKPGGINVSYPKDGVKGIYMSPSGFSDGEIRERNLALLEKSNLNAIVLDLKDDSGQVVSNIKSDNPLIEESMNVIYDIDETMNLFEEKNIYPIARIIVFRDNILSYNHPEYSFKDENGEVWVRSNGDLFSNPFMKEVWDYNVDIAKAAAEAGFKEVQFDYIRYPEGFGNIHEKLDFNMGIYEGSNESLEELRVRSINEFLDYAKSELEPYGIKLGVDIFGYTTYVGEDVNIGQNFVDMAERVDVVSSMIYPSHWSPGNFGIDYPDKEPYRLVDSYMEVEDSVLDNLDYPPITRPWLQDFTASYLQEGTYMEYGINEVLEQIKALREHGVNEFLLWNAGNYYSETEEY